MARSHSRRTPDANHRHGVCARPQGNPLRHPEVPYAHELPHWSTQGGAGSTAGHGVPFGERWISVERHCGAGVPFPCGGEQKERKCQQLGEKKVSSVVLRRSIGKEGAGSNSSQKHGIILLFNRKIIKFPKKCFCLHFDLGCSLGIMVFGRIFRIVLVCRHIYREDAL